MKVYLARFTKNGKTAYKIGHTKWFKSIKRFSDDAYKIFDSIEIIDDIDIQHRDARMARLCAKLVESILQAYFPKNFWLEKYFLTEDNVFDGLSGITEMFILEYGQTEDDIIKIFQRAKKNAERTIKESEKYGDDI